MKKSKLSKIKKNVENFVVKYSEPMLYFGGVAVGLGAGITISKLVLHNNLKDFINFKDGICDIRTGIGMSGKPGLELIGSDIYGNTVSQFVSADKENAAKLAIDLLALCTDKYTCKELAEVLTKLD